MRAILRWTLPGGVLFVAAAVLDRWAGPELLLELTRGYPWVACAAGFLLGALFHRSRVAVAALAVALTAWGLGTGWPPEVAATAVIVTLGVLAPMRDLGITAPASLGQWLGTAAVVALATMVGSGGAPEIASALGAQAPPGAGLAPGVLAWLGLSRAQLGVYGLALVPMGFATVRRRGAVERSFLWCVALVVVGLRPGTEPGTGALYLLAAGLTLTLSVLETSYAMAYRDELTGLPARRALVRDLDALGPPYALAMVDVDHFKKFNDRHGHDTGDQVLRMVAGRLARAPGGIRAYRYGGEEFTLLLPGKDREQALAPLEAVREAVEHTSFAVRSWKRPSKKPKGGAGKTPTKTPRRLSVTVSIGVADSTGAGPDGPDGVLKKADKALYRAKRAGRNRVSK